MLLIIMPNVTQEFKNAVTDRLPLGDLGVTYAIRLRSLESRHCRLGHSKSSQVVLVPSKFSSQVAA